MMKRLCLRLAFLAVVSLALAQPAAAESALEFAAAGMGRPGDIVQPLRPAARERRHEPRVYTQFAEAVARSESVLTSWYGGGERLNRHTASGEVFRPNGMTAAHRTLPLGTRLAVTYAGRTIVVRVNDRGPARWTGRSLDLSRGAAHALGFAGRGTARVRIAVLTGG